MLAQSESRFLAQQAWKLSRFANYLLNLKTHTHSQNHPPSDRGNYQEMLLHPTKSSRNLLILKLFGLDFSNIVKNIKVNVLSKTSAKNCIFKNWRTQQEKWRLPTPIHNIQDKSYWNIQAVLLGRRCIFFSSTTLLKKDDILTCYVSRSLWWSQNF